MPISKTELANARKAWGDGLVAISKAYEADGIDGARAVANDVLDAAYGYTLGPVLFKPTMASGEKTFRPTKDGQVTKVDKSFGYKKDADGTLRIVLLHSSLPFQP